MNPIPSSACSCAELSSVQDEVDRSDAVFSGEVLEVTEKTNGYGYASVLLEVDTVWKGIDQTQVILSTGLGGGDCGIKFHPGFDYLVYASSSSMYDENHLETTICDRTDRLSGAAEDLDILGDGKEPSEQVDLKNGLGKTKFFPILVWGVLGFLVIGTLAFVMLYRKTKIDT